MNHERKTRPLTDDEMAELGILPDQIRERRRDTSAPYIALTGLAGYTWLFREDEGRTLVPEDFPFGEQDEKL